MPDARLHLRNTFLAGIFAAIPIAITVAIAWYLDHYTRALGHWLFGHDIPGVGVVIAVLAIYLLGLAVTSIVGRFFVTTIDRILLRLPLLREVYVIWKQVFLTPGGGEGMFAKVVLVPDAVGVTRQLGFTNGVAIDEHSGTICVFVPAAPNPINGRLIVVKETDVLPTTMTAEEAFKIILSTGNYVPPALGASVGMKESRTK